MVPTVSSLVINDVIRTSLLLVKIWGKVGRVGGLEEGENNIGTLSSSRLPQPNPTSRNPDARRFDTT